MTANKDHTEGSAKRTNPSRAVAQLRRITERHLWALVLMRTKERRGGGSEPGFSLNSHFRSHRLLEHEGFSFAVYPKSVPKVLGYSIARTEVSTKCVA
jgi:hypothetical protein